MWAIISKEFKSFFSSFIGLGIMTAFYVLMALYTWFLPGNILDYGFAELTVFFDLSPWFFMFFIPAICMRLFAEEFELKTFDLLRSLPISLENIIVAKVLAVLGMILVALLPTSIFVYSIGALGDPVYNYDGAVIAGGYVSLFLLCFLFTCLSALASALVEKQALAFVLGLVFNFLVWQGMQEIPALVEYAVLNQYQQIAKGLITFSGLVYFLGLGFMCIGLIDLRLRIKFN